MLELAKTGYRCGAEGGYAKSYLATVDDGKANKAATENLVADSGEDILTCAYCKEILKDKEFLAKKIHLDLRR